MTLNLATLYEHVAAAVPQRPAVSCGTRRLSFAELDRRANAVANHLVGAGLEAGEHVGVYMLNGVEFVEVLLGCLKARLAPININYRYTENELLYLFNDAQLSSLVVERQFAPHVAALGGQCTHLRHVLLVAGDDADETSPEDASVSWPTWFSVDSYETALVEQPTDAPRVDERGPDDRYVLYTGGTTGLPKGVVWRQEDFYFAALSGGNPYGDPHPNAEALAGAAARSGPLTFLITMPLMHGAASYTLFTGLFGGSHMILMRRYDPLEALRLVQDEGVQIMAVVGDAMARPFVDALRQHSGEYDLSSLFVLGSGGAILSETTQRELLDRLPNLMVRNSFGSSESGSDGQLTVGADGRMRMPPSANVMVVDSDHTPLEPGSEEVGFVARTGHVPVGYFNHPEKSARTFPVIDGLRWSILGDVAQVESDGTVVILGRGSGCINTGGEKVYPEEVEQALKAHPAVLDVLVAGAPHERFGEVVGAAVELRPGHFSTDPERLREHCRSYIAGYKVPARITLVDRVVRSPSGKADYRWAREILGAEPADN